jgi:alkylation response protein AidB-like acyl-CoA dehydrogenase
MVGTSGVARLTETVDGDDVLVRLSSRASALDGDVAGALDLAVELGSTAPLPGGGSTPRLWEMLATVAAADLTVARVVEPHLDALAVLAQVAGPPLEGAPVEGAGVGHPDSEGAGSGLAALGVGPTSTWGVFAAEASGVALTAEQHDGAWTLTGTKPWCSLAAELTHALVTAHVGGGRRRLFAVDLRADGVVVQPDRWVARGLSAVRSGPVDFSAVPAHPVGADGWYLARPGFTWGAVGVAAIWWGGALGVARRTAEWARPAPADAAAAGRSTDPIAMMHLGVTDLEVETGRLALRHAAEEIDRRAALPAGEDAREGIRRESRILAQRTRSVVARAAEEIVRTSRHAMGPAPLALEERHARRVADLELYLRQDHAEVDTAALGRALVEREGDLW